MNNECEKYRVGLLTPYTGSNLGDGAIQDAVIENLRSRLSGVSFCLFTLDPVKTTFLHGVPSLPITGHIVHSYSNTLKNSSDDEESSWTPSGEFARLKGRMKKRAAARYLLRPPWLFAKAWVNTFLNIGREVRHIAKMKRLLNDFRLLIVSGGGQIDDYWGGPLGHPYTLLKWAILAKAVGVKFVFLSVGFCTLEHSLSHLIVRKTLEMAQYRSYRDKGSKRLLGHMEVTCGDKVVPDLAFSYSPPMGLEASRGTGTSLMLRIGISPIAYLLKELWPREDKIVFNRYLEVLVAFSAELLRKGHEIVLFATDAPDHEVIEKVLEKLEEKALAGIHSKLRRGRDGNVQEVMEELAKLDVVVASRLHGIILSHLCGKPVLAISYDRKVTDYMEEMDQGKYCIDIHALLNEDLAKAFDSLNKNQNAIRPCIKEKIRKLRGSVMIQYDFLVQALGDDGSWRNCSKNPG